MKPLSFINRSRKILANNGWRFEENDLSLHFTSDDTIEVNFEENVLPDHSSSKNVITQPGSFLENFETNVLVPRSFSKNASLSIHSLLYFYVYLIILIIKFL